MSLASAAAARAGGEGPLFAGFLRLAPACTRCGLNFSFAAPADGPAFFVMTGVVIAVIGVFTWVEVAYAPPIWALIMTVFVANSLKHLANTLASITGRDE